MTTPPPPQEPQGPGPAQQPPPGQPPTPAPGYPMPPQQYGPPPGQYPGWPPAGPPKKSNGLKWVLAGVALIAVIAVAVAITVVVLRSDSGSGGKDGSSSTPEIASANDTGPVGVITDEPTCDKFMPINDGIANQSQGGWGNRDRSKSANEWGPEDRAQYEAAGKMYRNTAERMAALAEKTPNRVVRELYEQYTAYARAYADSIPNYSAHDNYLVLVANDILATLKNLCRSISEGSASAWSSAPALETAPSSSVAPSKLGKPQRLFINPDPICNDWIATLDRANSNLAEWAQIDAQTPASQWTPEEKSVIDTIKPVMSTLADDLEQLGQRSSSPTVRDFANLNAQYTRAYVQSLPTYVSADVYLINTANNVATAVMGACQAVGS